MKPDTKRLVPLLLCIITALLVASCQSQPVLTPISSPGIGVGISSDVCPNIETRVGQQVTWTNMDSREHIVRHKPEKGDLLFDSGVLQPGDSFTFVFVEGGAYPYECSDGRDVKGSVIVQP